MYYSLTLITKRLLNPDIPYVKCFIVFVAFSDKNYIFLPAEFCMHTKSPHPWIQEPKLAAKSRKQKAGHFDLANNLLHISRLKVKHQQRPQNYLPR